MPDLVTGRGQAVRLGVRLAAGGEGAVHALPDRPEACAKLYHPGARTAERRVKLEAMLARVPRDPTAAAGHRSLAWPEELLLEGPGGRCAGFLMPLLPAGARTALEYLQPEDRIRSHPGFHFGYLLTAARNTASAFAAIHQAGCCVGDVNESNTMITASALVTLIDCDSFQVPGPGGPLRCPVGKPEYTAPELAGRPLGLADRTPASDAFGLAVLIFQLLMQGFHPFSGRWRGAGEPPDAARRIRDGLYAYGGHFELDPPPAAPGLAVLPRGVRAAFDAAFGVGVAEPARRPSAADWVRVLDEGAAELRPCRASSAQHQYPRRLRTCPWCALARRGLDYFPPAVGTQIALPAARGAPARPPASASPPADGRPRLVLEPAELAISDVVRGGPARTATLTLRNVGRGWFRGEVAVAPVGIEIAVQPTEVSLSPFHGENEIRLAVRVDAGSIDWGRRYVRTVRAGQASARLVVTAADDAAAGAVSRFYLRMGIWASVALPAGLSAAAGAGGWAPAAAAVRRLWSAVFVPGAPLRRPALLLWIAACAACALASRLWRLRPNWRAWRGLLADRRWSPAAAAGALGLLAWAGLAVWRGGRFVSRPTAAGLQWDLAVLLVPTAWLGARALAWAAGDAARHLVSRRGAGFWLGASIAAALAIGAVLLAAGALLAAGRHGVPPPPPAPHLVAVVSAATPSAPAPSVASPAG